MYKTPDTIESLSEMKLSHRVIGTREELHCIEHTWCALYKDADLDVFQSFEWFDSWWQHFQTDSRLFCLYFADQNEKIVCIAPCIISVEYNQRVLQFSGGNLSDYNCFIIKDGLSKKEGTKLVFSTLSNYLGIYFDSIHLKHIDLLRHNMLEVNFQELGLAYERLNDELAMRVSLPRTLEEYYDKIGKKRRKIFDYYEKRLFKDEQIQFNFLTNKNEVVKYIDWFKEQKKQLWEKYHLFDKLPPEMKGDNFFNYLEHIILKNSETQFLSIPCLVKGDTFLVSGVYFCYKKTIFKFIQSWDYRFKNLSVGTVLDWVMVKHAIENEYAFFDLGRGDEEYKYKFGADQVRLSSFQLTRP